MTDRPRKSKAPLIATLIIVGVLLQILLGVLFYQAIQGFLSDYMGDDEGDGGDGLPEEELPVREPLNNEIFSVELNPSTMSATVSYTAYDDCRLSLRFIEEDSFFSMKSGGVPRYFEGCYGSVDLDVDEYNRPRDMGDTAECIVSVSGSLPEKYVIEAGLYDTEGEPLGSFYYDIRATRRMDEFEALTADKYEGEGELIRFEDKPDTHNFGVLAEGVKVMTAREIRYIEDDYEGYKGADDYEIYDPSGEINRGDRIYITDGKTELIFEAFYAKKRDYGYSVTSYTESAGFSDFFDFLKLDMTLNAPTEVEVEPLGFGDKHEFDKDFLIVDENFYETITDYAYIRGKLHYSATRVHGYFIWAPKIFGADYFEFEIKTETRADFSAYLNVEYEMRDPLFNKRVGIPIIEKSIPLRFPGLTYDLGLNAMISWQHDGVVGYEHVPVILNTGMRYTAYEGFKSLGARAEMICSDDPKEWLTVDGSVEAYIGLKAYTGIGYAKGVLALDFNVEAGLDVYATSETDLTEGTAVGLQHKCSSCIDGAVDSSYSLYVSCGCRWINNANVLKKDFNAGNRKDKLAFYISVPEEGDAPIYRKGDCQNYVHPIEVLYRCPLYYYMYCDTYYVENGLFYFREEGRISDQYRHSDGAHGHVTESITVTLTDLDTGEEIDKFVFQYDREGTEGRLLVLVGECNKPYVEIPITVKRIRVSADVTCRVYECNTYSGPANIIGDRDDDWVREVYNDYIIKNHTVEYVIEQDYKMEWRPDQQTLWGDAYGPNKEDYPFLPVGCYWLEEGKY